MSNHFTLASQRSQKSSSIPTDARSPAINLQGRKETAVIDLANSDDERLSQNHIASHQQSIQQARTLEKYHQEIQNELSQAKYNEIYQKVNLKSYLASQKFAKNLRSKLNTAKTAEERESAERLARVFGLPNSPSASYNGPQPAHRPQKMEPNPFAVRSTIRRAEKKSQNNQTISFHDIVDLTKSAPIQWPPNVGAFYENASTEMNLCLSSNVPESLPRSNQNRRTRSSGLAASMYADNEMKTRFKVAKFRFKIPKHIKAIHQVFAAVQNRLHFGPNRAVVQSQPIIPPTSDKHKILVHCLRLQLRKRKFIDLQQGNK